MKTVTAYATADGHIYATESAAKEHEDDLIGQELDVLFDVFKLKSGNMAMGHQAIYHACVAAIENRESLREVCAEIVRIIECDI